VTEHTPTTDEVRWCYRSEGRDPKGGRLDKEFDRWFAPYAEALANLIMQERKPNATH